MNTKLFRYGILSLVIALASTAFSATQWTYRNMFEARKACAEYYFSIYTNGKDHGRNPKWIRDEDIQSFYDVARQSAADMLEFADILDTPYTKATFDGGPWENGDNTIPAGVVLPYSNGKAIPYFGVDFQYAIPGYSVVPPKDIVQSTPTVPVETIVTLYSFNGYKDTSQVTPDHVYVYGMGMTRTVKDCEKADWYSTPEAAIAAGNPAPAPSLWGDGEVKTVEPQVWASRGTVLADGTLKLDSWVIIRK